MKIPVILVTGFLGSGKTTFINWFLAQKPELKISIILNEFGNIKLESQFIDKASKANIIELANGCMCCVAKSDIPRTIRYIIEQSPETEYILVEASGLSDPDPIKHAISDPSIVDRVNLHSIVCIVDAINFENNLHSHRIVITQIGDADKIVISKVHEVSEAQLAEVNMVIKNQGLDSEIIYWDQSTSAEKFITREGELSSISEILSDSAEHQHEHEEYNQFWFTTDKALDLSKLRNTMNAFPENVIRVKGMINIENKKVLVQFVSKSLQLTYTEEPISESKLLIIGRNLDEQNIRKSLELCMQ